MNNRYESVIKTFNTIKNMKTEDDSSIADDVFLNTPASNVGNISLETFDDEIEILHKMSSDEDIDFNSENDYSETDFIDPNASKEAQLSPEEETEILGNFSQIEQRIKNVLNCMDLRLYLSDRATLKKSIYDDMFSIFMNTYEYVPKKFRQRLAGLVSVLTDQAISSLTTNGRRRTKHLFRQLETLFTPFIDEQISKTKETAIDDMASLIRFTDWLFRTVNKQFIEPQRQLMHYSPDEYKTICQLTRSIISKKIK